jgi:hypothetical protein
MHMHTLSASTVRIVSFASRENFSAILAIPRRKQVEYRVRNIYWKRRLLNPSNRPIELRLMCPSLKPIPEALISINEIFENEALNLFELRLGNLISLKNWNRRIEAFNAYEDFVVPMQSENKKNGGWVSLYTNHEVINLALQNGGFGLVKVRPNNSLIYAVAQTAKEDSVISILISTEPHEKHFRWSARLDSLTNNGSGYWDLSFWQLQDLTDYVTLNPEEFPCTPQHFLDKNGSRYHATSIPDHVEKKIKWNRSAYSNELRWIAKYKTALSTAKEKSTNLQLHMLFAHYAAPNMTASVIDLAKQAGYTDVVEGIRAYEEFCTSIYRALDVDCHFSAPLDTIAQRQSVETNSSLQWTLDDEIAIALEELGWITNDGVAINQKT